MTRGGALVGVGLAPFWLALAVVTAEGFASGWSSNFWVGAPWLIVLSMPCCLVTLIIAAVAPITPSKQTGRFGNGRKW